MKAISYLFLASFAAALPAAVAGNESSWNAPDRAEKVAKLIPGRTVPMLSPKDLFADWTRGQVSRWAKEHPPLADEEAFRAYAAAAPTDEELTRDFPDHISPFGRVLAGTPPEWQAQEVLIWYCPFCGKRHARGFGPQMVEWDPQNRYHAVTLCCRQDLYGRERDFPADYTLRPNSAASFPHLDGSVKTVPGYTFTDKDGVTWQLFIKTFFDHMRWSDICGSLNSDAGKTGLYGKAGLVGIYLQKFRETADPMYVHKLAVLLDRIADTYYGLPLSWWNDLAKGKDGQPLTRAEWEALPRPAVFEKPYFGEWNRMNPLMARGWLGTEREQRLAEPFARVRHHPAFKYYSQKVHGDPDALDRKVMTKLMRETALMFESGIGSALQTEYQLSSDYETTILALLMQDRFLFDYAAASPECVLYNHHYHDGMNGEGAAGYMRMLDGFYAYLKDPNGWQELAPEFARLHPFLEPASTELRKVQTVRGLLFGFGDMDHGTYGPFPATPTQVQANEKLPSMNWPGFGMGVLRVGGPGHRMEVLLSYDKVALHGCADKLGIEAWVDGVPVMRPGGYAMYWMGAYLDPSRPDIKAFLAMPYPKEIYEAGHDGEGWSWPWAHSHVAHNTVSVNEIGTSRGWGDTEGFGDLVTYKGGEAPGELGSHFQVLDARDLYSFERMGVKIEEFRRTLLAVEGPDGRPYVVDIVRLRGGQRHALFQSAWGERAESALPPVASQESSMAKILSGNADIATLPDYKKTYSVYEPFTHVEALAPAGDTWGVTWKTDWAAYAPFDAAGKPQPRPIPEELGRVRLRLLALKQQENTTLISAKGPWVPFIKQPVPNGGLIQGIVAFRDAYDYLIEAGRLEANNAAGVLESTFVHILEGYREGEGSVIGKVTRLAPAKDETWPAGSLAIRLEFTAGHSDTVIFQPSPGKMRVADGLETDAGYALVRRGTTGEVMETHFARGTYLTAGNDSGRISGDLHGVIVDIIGDLTGTRLESALVVKPDTTWPTDTALVGKPISIEVATPLRTANHEVYTIAKVTPLADGLLRVDLANAAPFIWGWHSVGWIDPARPNRVKTNRPLIAGIGTPWLWGAKAWFPELRQTYTVRKTEADRVTMELADNVDLNAKGVKLGDWFALYTIEPGCQVTVPGSFAFRKDK